MKTRVCDICGEERQVGSEIGARGKAKCRRCQNNPRHEIKGPIRFCKRCQNPRTIGTEISPHGKICFACQAAGKAERQKAAYNSDPEYRKLRLERKRRNYAERKAHDPEAYQREREQQKAYRQAHPDKQREYNAAYREKVLSDPERRKARRERERDRARRRRQQDPAFREHQRQLAAAAHHRLRSDPVKWAEHLADQRMRYRLRKQANGEPVIERNYRNPRPMWFEPTPRNGSHTAPMVEAEPLRDFLVREFPNEITEELAERFEIDGSGLHRLLAGRYKRVSLSTADQILTRAGAPHQLSLLYPQLT